MAKAEKFSWREYIEIDTSLTRLRKRCLRVMNRIGWYDRMKRAMDLTDKRFGRLIVIRRNEAKLRNRTHATWICRCDCGNIKVVRQDNLVSGQTRSCGCLLKENYKNFGFNNGEK